MSYTVALFIHILGALGFFASLGVFYVSILGMRRATTVGALRLWAGATNRLARFTFPISGLLLLVFGIYMLVVSSQNAVWASVGFVMLLVIGFVTGVFQIRPIAVMASQTRDLAADAPVPDSLATRARSSLLWVTANTMLLLTIGVVYLMTVKPDLLGSLIALVVALVVGVLIGALTQGRSTPVGAATVASN